MTEPLAEFTVTHFSAVSVHLAATSPARLADELHKRFAGADRYFTGEVALLDFSRVRDWPSQVDWAGIAALMRRIGLQPIGVRNVPEHHHTALARHNLALLDQVPATESPPLPSHSPHRDHPFEASQTPSSQVTEEPHPGASLVVDRPVRSGQQIHHPHGDVILLAGINPGGEVIAAGHIVCWGPLAGRAIAGAYGFEHARIFAQRFQPELIAIAGIFQTFDQGIPSDIAGKAAQVRLASPHQGGELRLQFDAIES